MEDNKNLKDVPKEAYKENETQWLINREKDCVTSLDFIRNSFGSYYCDRDPTFNRIEGFLCAVRTLIREKDL